MLLQQILPQLEQRQLQEALGAIALHSCSECLVHVLARVLRIEEQRIEQRRDQAVVVEQHGLVGVCTNRPINESSFT